MCGNFSRVISLFSLVYFLTLNFVYAKDEALRPTIKEMTSEKASREAAAQVPVSNPSQPSSFNSSSEIHIHSFGIGIGQTSLSGNFTDRGDDKITPSFFYTYSASYSFDFIAEFHSDRFKNKTSWVRLTALPIGIKAKLLQFDAFTPFAIGGLGFYFPKENRVGVETESKASLGVHLGVGSDLELNRNFSVGILAAYYNPFDVPQESIESVSGHYYKLLLMGLYHF